MTDGPIGATPTSTTGLGAAAAEPAGQRAAAAESAVEPRTWTTRSNDDVAPGRPTEALLEENELRARRRAVACR